MTGDVTIDQAVVRQGLAEMLSPVQADVGPKRALRLLHEPDDDGDTGGNGGADEGVTVLVREGSLSLKSHPRQPGTASAAMADLSAVVVLQVPAGLSAMDERAMDRTVNRLKLLLEDGEWEAVDGTLVQIDEWEETDAGPEGGDGDRSINYAAFRVSGLVSRHAGTSVTTVTPPEESEEP